MNGRLWQAAEFKEAETDVRAVGHRGRGPRGASAQGMVRRACRMKEEGGSVGMVLGPSSAAVGTGDRCVGAGSGRQVLNPSPIIDSSIYYFWSSNHCVV